MPNLKLILKTLCRMLSYLHNGLLLISSLQFRSDIKKILTKITNPLNGSLAFKFLLTNRKKNENVGNDPPYNIYFSMAILLKLPTTTQNVQQVLFDMVTLSFIISPSQRRLYTKAGDYENITQYIPLLLCLC